MKILCGYQKDEDRSRYEDLERWPTNMWKKSCCGALKKKTQKNLIYYVYIHLWMNVLRGKSHKAHGESD